MKACVFVHARDAMLVVKSGTTHHLSDYPCEQRPAVPEVYLSTTHTFPLDCNVDLIFIF